MAKKASAGSAGGRRRLRATEVAAALRELPGWARTPDGAAIERTYSLPSFRAALAFVAFVGEIAEARNHHPDVDLRYHRVKVALSTHDAGGITASDLELARLIDGMG